MLGVIGITSDGVAALLRLPQQSRLGPSFGINKTQTAYARLTPSKPESVLLQSFPCPNHHESTDLERNCLHSKGVEEDLVSFRLTALPENSHYVSVKYDCKDDDANHNAYEDVPSPRIAK